jgi:hypothetical protein
MKRTGLAAILLAASATHATSLLESPDGVPCALQLPARRSNWNSCDWKVVPLPAGTKLAGNAVRLAVTTAQPRADAGVYLAFGEADGSWYCHPWAANLTQPVNRGVARLADFSPCEWTSPGTPAGKFLDENGQLDPDQITRVAFGTVNGLGVGPVEFTVTELVTTNLPTPPVGPLEIEVTGQWLAVNGTTMLPAGLFGGFNLKEMPDKTRRVEHYRLALDRSILQPGQPTPTTPLVVQVVGGDRGVPSPRLTNPNWQAEATAAGTKLGRAPPPVFAEYYNEPYLNWANKNRRAFNPKFFDESRAVEGGPVHIKHDGTVAPHLKWTKNYDAVPWAWCSRRDWRRGKDATGKVYSEYAEPPHWAKKQSSWAPETHPPEDVKDGETYTVKIGKPGEEKEVTLTAFTPWWIYDETQFTYWSARGLGMFYNEPMVAFGQAFKAAGGTNVTYIAGWGFRPSEDHWAAFDLAFQPTIDAGIAVMDGIGEHDYGGDPTKAVASYEVVCAYSLTRHGKWLYGFNTECSGNPDPEAFAQAGAQGSPELFGARWISAKILHALDYVPDKARSFAHFGGGNFFHDAGEGLALQALINLRGRLLWVKSSAPDVYVAAAVDGTDPLAPRPARLGDRRELVVAAYNAGPAARPLALRVNAPAGTTLGTPTFKHLKAQAGKPVVIEAKPEQLGSRELIVATYPLAGELAEVKPVRREQFFSDVIVRPVTPQEPVTTTIAGKPGAKRAWFQYVAERLADREATISLNGTTVALPAAVTPENAPRICRLPVDPQWVKASNAVRVQIADPAHAGFLLGCLSLVVETE